MLLSKLNPNIKKCPFCYINPEKTRIIYSKPLTMVILSNPRLVTGHLLVIPKKHVEKLTELTQEEKNELINTVINFQEKILSKISKGCDIRQNYHPFQKQNKIKVDHLHIHLIPRSLHDKLFLKIQIHETKLFAMMNNEELEQSKLLFS